MEEKHHLFVDRIQGGEQEKINGNSPAGKTVMSLTELKKNNAAKSCLFHKYYNMCFVDKNPESKEGAEPLEDESKWEHRIIKDVVWWRSMGFSVESHLIGGGVVQQSVEKYEINRELIRMIRESPHNVRPLLSRDGLDDEGLDEDTGKHPDAESDDDVPLCDMLTDIRKKNTSS